MHFSARAARRLVACLALAAAAGVAQRGSNAQQPIDTLQRYTKWNQYGGASDSMQYSALAQINKSNVTKLQRAWFYHVAGEPARIVFNPLIVDNVMYVRGADGVITALRQGRGAGLSRVRVAVTSLYR